jgi:hypothetical protein
MLSLTQFGGASTWKSMCQMLMKARATNCVSVIQGIGRVVKFSTFRGGRGRNDVTRCQKEDVIKSSC